MINIQVKILNERMRGMLPAYATAGSAGLDLRACIEEPLMLAPGESKLISTGIAIHVGDPNYMALLIPRSGLGAKSGIVLGNLIGLIDSDYQGPLMVSLWNRNPTGGPEFVIQPMDRVAQMMIVPVVQAQFTEVSEFASSARGIGGFGSTGV